MKNYDKSLIDNFILGNNLGDYTAEELSQNVDFMIAVFENKKTTAWYSLCGDKVKCDYDFNKYLINNFKYDLSFLQHVILYIYRNMNDRILFNDLLIYYNAIVKVPFDIYNNSISEVLDDIYTKYRFSIDIKNQRIKNSKSSMGFNELLSRGVCEKEILDFYANRMVREIANKNIKNFSIITSKCIYNNYYDEIENYISKYDTALSKYIDDNKYILINWDNNEREEQEKYTNDEQEELVLMINEVKDFYKNHSIHIPLKEMVYFVAKQLNAIDKIYLYDRSKDKDLEKYLSNEYDKYINKKIKDYSDNYYAYLMVKRIMTRHINNINSKYKGRTRK